MAYVPNHLSDVFISYCHDDDFVWIERFKQELNSALARKLRARTKPEIFFDAHKLRAGRDLDSDIPACLERTGFFLAMVSPRYNGSTYCRHKELAKFLRHHSPSSGRLIQVQLDLSARLPVDEVLAVPFADPKALFRPEGDEYRDALRRVYEPIVSELDNLYAQSKMIFLAWPGDPQLEEARTRLESEIEGRYLRVFPEAVAEYESEFRLRDALSRSTTSVHFFGSDATPFDLRQWAVACSLDRPCIVASRHLAETRRGPAGSPAPFYLGHGNPIVAIARAIEQIAGIGTRDEHATNHSLGKTPVFLVFNSDPDALLGMKIRKRIINGGPFEVIVPPAGDGGARFEDLSRAKAALLCKANADRDWLKRAVTSLNSAMVASKNVRSQARLAAARH